jgi:hypothetical protein
MTTRENRRIDFGGKPPLSVSRISEWADDSHARAGRWPTRKSGRVAGELYLTWNAVDLALSKGLHGLPGGSSSPKLLHERRSHRHRLLTPRLTVNGILAWADAHRTLYGVWPSKNTGPIGATGESWCGVDSALRVGLRGLRGGSSLAQFLRVGRRRASQGEEWRPTAP